MRNFFLNNSFNIEHELIPSNLSNFNSYYLWNAKVCAKNVVYKKQTRDMQNPSTAFITISEYR